MRVFSPRAWLLVLALAAALLLPGCAVNGLSFVQDDRVDIIEPKANDTVELPFEIRWTAKDYDGAFVVFFDRPPMRPNQSLVSLVPRDDPCRFEPGCPDAQWLEDREIYVVEGTSLMVSHLHDERTTGRAKDRHEVTVALLDQSGRRVGESAFTKEFIVDRGD